MIKTNSFIIAVALALGTVIPATAQCYDDSCSCNTDCRKGGHFGCHSGCLAGCLAGHKACYMCYADRRAALYNWHGNYNHSAYGQPIALVVPPTARLQTNWSWGAPSSRISRIDHQFGRNYPGPGAVGGAFRNTPPWPADTAQFGVYYVRSPWYPMQR